MKSRINIRYFNVILLVTAAVAFTLALVWDANNIFKAKPLDQISIFAPGISDPHEILVTILDAIAAAIFLFVAYKYNAIRKKKADKYLSSLIFYSAIYLGMSWVVEIFHMDVDSELTTIIDIMGKYYMPLSIFSGLFLSYVAYEVFIEPTMPKDRTDPLSFFIILSTNS